MAVISLVNYQHSDPVRYTLDLRSGGVTATRFKSYDEATQNTAGFGAWRSFGPLRDRRKLFIAFYTDGKTLWMRIGDQVFDWADPGLRVTRTPSVPFVKCFAVYRRDTLLLRLRYWYVDWHAWPDNGDICSYIERTTRTRADVLRAIFFWTAHAEGRDLATQAFADELDRKVQEALLGPNPKIDGG